MCNILSEQTMTHYSDCVLQVRLFGEGAYQLPSQRSMAAYPHPHWGETTLIWPLLEEIHHTLQSIATYILTHTGIY